MFPLIFLFSGLSWWCSGRITNILAKYFKCPFNQSPSSFSCSPFSREGQISLKTSHPCTYSNQPSCFLMMSICSGGGMVMVRAMWRRRRRGGVWSTHKEPVPHCHCHGSVCSGGGWSWRGRRCIDLLVSSGAEESKTAAAMALLDLAPDLAWDSSPPVSVTPLCRPGQCLWSGWSSKLHGLLDLRYPWGNRDSGRYIICIEKMIGELTTTKIKQWKLQYVLT